MGTGEGWVREGKGKGYPPNENPGYGLDSDASRNSTQLDVELS